MKTYTAHVTFQLSAEQIHKLRHSSGYRCTEHLGSAMYQLLSKEFDGLMRQFDDGAKDRRCPACKSFNLARWNIEQRLNEPKKPRENCSVCGHKLTAGDALRNCDVLTQETIADLGLNPVALAYPAHNPDVHNPLAGIETTPFDTLLDECNKLLEDGEEDDTLEAAIAEATKAVRRIVKRSRQQRAMAEGLVLHG